MSGDGGARRRPLADEVAALLVEAGWEVAGACPWLPVGRTGRAVRAAHRLRLVGRTVDLFGITPKGVLALRRAHPECAKAALAGLRRNAGEGSVMPWDVAYDPRGRRPPRRLFEVAEGPLRRVSVRAVHGDEAEDLAFDRVDRVGLARGMTRAELDRVTLTEVARPLPRGPRRRRVRAASPGRATTPGPA